MSERIDSRAIICPHCEWHDFDTEIYRETGKGGQLCCRECGRWFQLAVQTKYRFITRPSADVYRLFYAWGIE